MAGIMKNSPPNSVAIVDSMGSALPRSIQYLVRKMKSMTNGLPVEVHTHNDFGIALATELAGLEAGANVVHSCVNGLGERTGNVATEELVVALKILYGVDNDYKLDKLVEVCQMVEKISGVALAENKPIAGSRNYTRELGSGIDLVLRQPLAMFSTDPRYFGRTGEIVLGKKSSKASVEYFLQKNNLEVPDTMVDVLLKTVKEVAVQKKGLLTNEAFVKIVSSIAKGESGNQ
jgi:methanogen homocitrate synthase